MNYKFDVQVSNNNYPLVVGWRPHTCSKFQFMYIRPSEFEIDNGVYFKTISFDFTNYKKYDSEYQETGETEHNNIDCLSTANSRKVYVYSFQVTGKLKRQYDWLDFTNTTPSVVEERVSRLTLGTDDDIVVSIVQSTGSRSQVTMERLDTEYKKVVGCILPGRIYKLVMEFNEQEDTITKSVTISNGATSETIADLTFTRTTGDTFVSEDISDNAELSFIQTGQHVTFYETSTPGTTFSDFIIKFQRDALFNTDSDVDFLESDMFMYCKDSDRYQIYGSYYGYPLVTLTTLTNDDVTYDSELNMDIATDEYGNVFGEDAQNLSVSCCTTDVPYKNCVVKDTDETYLKLDGEVPPYISFFNESGRIVLRMITSENPLTSYMYKGQNNHGTKADAHHALNSDFVTITDVD